MIGFRELVLIVLVVLVLYGRAGVLKSQRFQAIWPWLAPVRRTPRRPPAHRTQVVEPAPENEDTPRRQPFLFTGNRLYWFLTILAATAVAAWIVTRVMISSGVTP